MATPVEMPKLGNTVEECLLARWCKHPGDAVAEGEVVAEIETDKASFELTAPVGGAFLGAFFKEGDLIPVFANVCVLGTPGEDIEAFRPKIIAAIPAAKPQSTATPLKHNGSEPRPVEDSSVEFYLSPRARRFAEEHHFRPKNIRGSGPGGRILEEDLKQLYYGSPRNSSLAEKMIDSGYEIRGEGSGPNGMVLSGDLSSPPLKMSTVRERIAQRMRDSLTATAQYTMHASAEATGLLSLRARIKASPPNQDSVLVNINDMVVFCVIRALEAVPEVNVEFIDGKIYRHSSVHIGFACDTSKGLLVPVVHDSQKLTLPELARRIKALTQKAVDGGITPDELSGGTFTVSNLGTYGIESFSPILNPPQVAILGVNTIELKPVRRNGAIEFIEHIGLSLTCDHQVIDGAPGARFLKTVKEQIENIEIISGMNV
jgi:pyruvate dehydrogenase E2 component (dihydrolipoamide acetyltransferase)